MDLDDDELEETDKPNDYWQHQNDDVSHVAINIICCDQDSDLAAKDQFHNIKALIHACSIAPTKNTPIHLNLKGRKDKPLNHSNPCCILINLPKTDVEKQRKSLYLTQIF